MIPAGASSRHEGAAASGGTGAERRPAALALCLCLLAPAALPAADAPDDLVEQRIMTRLAGQVSLHPEGLRVEVTGGTARVTGTVASVGERQSVERLVGGVVGVRRVVNDLLIRPSKRSEAAIVQEVRRLLDRRVRFRSRPPNVEVSGGVVTLTGEVDRALDRVDAETIASNVEGVTRVENGLRVRETAGGDPEEVRRRVQSLLVNPLTFGAIRDLRVEIEDGRVTLRGVARRLEDRLQAERLALTVSGVREVVNAIEVAGS